MSSYGIASYGVDSYGVLDAPIIPIVPGGPGIGAAVLSIAPPLIFVTAGQTITPTPCDLGIGPDGELLLTPHGDLALVSGRQRVAQDVWMLAIQPLGSNYGDPAIGSRLAGLIGRRMPDQATLGAYAGLLQRQVAALQQRRITQGDSPGAGEAIDTIIATATKTGANTVTAALAIHTQDNQETQTAVPLA